LSQQHSLLIPNYITAQTPQGLRRLMFQENAKYGAQLQFFDIQQFNDGRSLKWIAWFFAPLKNISELEGT
jgi:hypothetical protein